MKIGKFILVILIFLIGNVCLAQSRNEVVKHILIDYANNTIVSYKSVSYGYITHTIEGLTIAYIIEDNPSSGNYNHLSKTIFSSEDKKLLRKSYWAIINNTPSLVRITENLYYDSLTEATYKYTHYDGYDYIVLNFGL